MTRRGVLWLTAALTLVLVAPACEDATTGSTVEDSAPTSPAADIVAGPDAGPQEDVPPPCVPVVCKTAECGDDGCGGSCGTCPTSLPVCEAGICVAACEPDCAGKACGEDGCGSLCGVCPAEGATCVEGICQEACEPACGIKACGDDGCGSLCGVCGPEAPDCVDGVCQAACVPACVGKVCGDDGCGSTCGACGPDTPDCVDGVCQGGCLPNCSAKACGDDGCGGSCGACPDGAPCTDGACPPVPPDPCQPNPCWSPPAPKCDGTLLMAADAPGLCTASPALSAVCVYEYAVTKDCAAFGATCEDGACVSTTDPPVVGDLAYASFIHQVSLSPGAGFDLNGDGLVDNGLADLMAAMAEFLGASLDLNAEIAAAIEEGLLLLLVEWVALDDPVDDPWVAINGYLGQDADGGSYEDNLTGSASFWVAPDSLDPETGLPLISVAPLVLDKSTLLGGPMSITFPIPADGDLYPITLVDAQLHAEVAVNPSGHGLDVMDGVIGGAVPMDSVWALVNAYEAAQCECLAISGPLLTWTGEGSTPVCADAPGECDFEICAALAEYCSLLVMLVQPDLDTDGNGVEDAISAGVYFGAVAAIIEGLGE